MGFGPVAEDFLDPVDIKKAETIFQRSTASFGDDVMEEFAREVLSSVAALHARFPQHQELPSHEDVERFSHALLAADQETSQLIIDVARDAGASRDVIYLGYLAAAARLLGEWWTEDRVSAGEVILGTGRIYSIIRGLRPLTVRTSPKRHAFFAAAPDETHTLGITVAAEMLRERGWDIDLSFGETHEELVSRLTASDHFIIGLSASRPSILMKLARLVVALRIRRPSAFILVSGQITELEPNLEDLIDADLIATDAEQAIVALERLVEAE